VSEACRPPKDVGVPVTQWSAHLLGQHLRGQDVAISDRMISRILHDADLQPHRQRMWLTSQDDEFRAKRDEVLRVYYEAAACQHVICLDEKTGRQTPTSTSNGWPNFWRAALVAIHEDVQQIVQALQ
jgi:hypothetical protein